MQQKKEEIVNSSTAIEELESTNSISVVTGNKSFHLPLNEIDGIENNEYVRLEGKSMNGNSNGNSNGNGNGNSNGNGNGNSNGNGISVEKFSQNRCFSVQIDPAADFNARNYHLFNSEDKSELTSSRQKQHVESDDKSEYSGERISGYIRLLSANKNYRLYLVSHFYRHFGDWFVHVANIIAIGSLVPESSTALAALIATKLVPNIIFPSFGGAIADSFDRRLAMICLDFLGAVITMGHILAIRESSVSTLYAVSFARATIAAMYEPVTRSIVPLMVPLQDLKKSAVLNASAWSTMTMVGGTVAGYTIALFGIELCYSK